MLDEEQRLWFKHELLNQLHHSELVRTLTSVMFCAYAPLLVRQLTHALVPPRSLKVNLETGDDS